ncbi:MAG TPA: hypothetical protein VFB58_16290 [Chloroflexota bacterium]|nr:hypothetical protein [Chloroflexota bacterium]
MTPRFRFGLILARQLLTVIQALWFPRESQMRAGRRSPRWRLLSRIALLAGAVLAIVQAWRELQRAEAGESPRPMIRRPRQIRLWNRPGRQGT